MAIQRIQRALAPSAGSHFLVLFGNGVFDTFLPSSGEEISIEAALLAELKYQNYQRVAFLAPHKPVYFMDAESEAYASPEGIQQRTPRADYEMQVLTGGPLGERQFLAKAFAGTPVTVETGMGDLHAIRFLDTILSDRSGVRTAVVILQAETTLRYFDDHRILAGIVGSWLRLPTSNKNLCLMVFSASEAAAMQDLAVDLPVPELRTMILNNRPSSSRSPVLRELAGPEEDEIERLLDHLRMRGTGKVTIEDRELLVDWIAAEDVDLRSWIDRLGKLKKIDSAVLKKRGWFSAARDQNRSIEERLQSLVGLDNIKQRIYEMAAWLRLHKARANTNGQAPLLHMIFSGNPGTGKTTIARLIGEIYHDIGVLRRGHLVEARISDLVADHVGGTSAKVDRLVDSALDGVLFIDEAYMLSEPERGGFGQEALDTLLSRMENDRQRLVVIAAGYSDKMRHFLDSNPGLQRRFPQENRFEFPDYSTRELVDIFKQMLAERGIVAPADIDEDVNAVIENLRSARDEHFGNAGEMRNLSDAVDRRRAARILRENLTVDVPMELSDLPPALQRYLSQETPDVKQALGELNELIGLTNVKGMIVRTVRRLELQQKRDPSKRGKNGQAIQHLVFTGNPGTGKTTVARLMGKIYQSIGLLKKGHCVEVTRADLVAGYVGQTAIKTMDRVKAALDGVLFIDEAYSLVNGASGDFGMEAVDTLVKAMEDYCGRILVIAAGYPEQMDDFINSNPGLHSRFAEPLIFPDYSVDELAQIIQHAAAADNFKLTGVVMTRIKQALRQMRQARPEQFGNARTALHLFEEMKDHLAERVLSGKSRSRNLDLFKVEDVPWFGMDGKIDRTQKKSPDAPTTKRRVNTRTKVQSKPATS
jgi:SpoVK/Ycf46/Vps4 family AAA+-type ATPase